MSNSTNMILGAKGDIISASAVYTPEILPVGTDGYVLAANSATASGLQWIPNPGSGEVIQYQYSSNSNYNVITTEIPCDNSIPQIGEGTEIITCSITPTNINNLLVIKFECPIQVYYNDLTGICYGIVALFQDAIGNALAAALNGKGIHEDGRDYKNLCFGHVMVAGTTLATTFRIRLGVSPTSTTGRIVTNGSFAAGALFGGVSRMTLSIMEIGA